MREKLGYRVLLYINDVLGAPCQCRRPYAREHLKRVRERLLELFRSFYIMHHVTKGCLEGIPALDDVEVER